MDDRYERAGTVGFRCAADLPTTQLAASAGACRAGVAPCGRFDAHDAFTSLTAAGVKDWATYGLVARMQGGSNELPANVTALSGNGESAVGCRYCPQYSKSATLKTSGNTFVPPSVVSAGAVSFAWSDGSAPRSSANISTGLCSPSGLRFTLPAKTLLASAAVAGGGRTLTIWAGVSAGTLRVNASLGTSPPFYTEELAAAPSDVRNKILRSNRYVTPVS